MEVDKLFKQVDINGSGKVDFTEFIIAAMNQEKILNVQKIEQAFRIFDSDGDGHISKVELENVMGDMDEEVSYI